MNKEKVSMKEEKKNIILLAKRKVQTKAIETKKK